MDRRTFLKSSTAAAAIPAGAAVAAAAPATSAVPSDRLRFVVPRDPLMRDHAERLGLAIVETTAGRIAIDWQDGPDETAALRRRLAAGDTDAAFAVASDALGAPALALFTGLPGPFGLAPHDLLTWHTVAGGGQLLDEAADALDVRILLAGHTGARPGLWADRDLADLRDAATVSVSATGLGRLVWQRISAPFTAPIDQRQGHVQELPGDPVCALRDARAAGLTHFFRDGLHANGTAFSLILSKEAWQRLDAPSRAAITTACRAALDEAIAISAHHHRTVLPALIKAGAIRARPLPDILRRAIDHTCANVIEDEIISNPALAPAWSAYRAFHHHAAARPLPSSPGHPVA